MESLVGSFWFDLFINISVLTTCVMLAIDDASVEKGSNKEHVIDNVNLALTCIFTFEAGLRIAAHGMDYFDSQWNCLDFFIVIISLASIPLSASGLDGVKGFRAARALRPLRLISHNVQLQLVLNTIGDVWILILILILIL